MKRKISEIIKEKAEYLTECYDYKEEEKLIHLQKIKQEYGDIDLDLGN